MRAFSFCIARAPKHQETHHAGLRYLSLRQNLLADGNMLSKAEFKGSLQELFINDNQLKAIPELTDFTALKRLEFSYNHEVCICLSCSSSC
jgi:hypothetical protein